MLTLNFYFNNNSSKRAFRTPTFLSPYEIVAATRNTLKEETFQGGYSKALFYFDECSDLLEVRYWHDFRYFVDCHYVTAEEFLNTLKKLFK